MAIFHTRQASAGTCGSAGSSDSSTYNMTFHIGSVLIILFVSATACAFPIIAARFPQFRIPPTFLFVVRHFGTGVLIATAFVHLLPTAFVSLTNPCLPKFWNETYPAMAGAIALAAVFAITIVEMVFTGRHTCAFPASMMSTDIKATPDSEKAATQLERTRDVEQLCQHTGLQPIRTIELSDSQHSVEDLPYRTTSSQQQSRAILQCLLLEVGILFHSVFIGMALAVAIGDDFIVLLIAISFHQTFEGLALGSRIASIDWQNHRRGSYQPWLMALAYGCTTPVGQVIGIATHTLYTPGSTVGLLMVGIMNAISSGLLIYASLVDLLHEDFLSDASWKLLVGRRRVVACILVFAGAFSMSLVGAWA